jgi:uncharacterized protein
MMKKRRNRKLEPSRLDITPLVPEDRQIVQSYGSGHFKVSLIDYRGSIIVLPNQTISWDVSILDDVNLETLAPVLAEDPRIEILLIGCGKMMQLLPRSLMSKGIGHRRDGYRRRMPNIQYLGGGRSSGRSWSRRTFLTLNIVVWA